MLYENSHNQLRVEWANGLRYAPSGYWRVNSYPFVPCLAASPVQAVLCGSLSLKSIMLQITQELVPVCHYLQNNTRIAQPNGCKHQNQLYDPG